MHTSKAMGLLFIAGLMAFSVVPVRADAVFASTYQGVSMYDASGNFIQNLALPNSPSIGNGLGGFVDPTGLAIGSDGLGCMGMSGVYGASDENESIATIHAALDAGVKLLDTGDFYGAHDNEMLIG